MPSSTFLSKPLWVLLGALWLAACGGGGGGSSSGPAPAPANSPPIADAGADQTANAGDTVVLDASLSRDNDGSITSYRWVQNDGPEVELADADSAQAVLRPRR